MQRALTLALLPLLLVTGCASQGPAGEDVRSDTVTLELDQETGEGSPMAGDGTNCLAVTPEGTLDRLEAELTWGTQGDAPDRLHLIIHQVRGGEDLAEATGGPALSVMASSIDSKVNIAVELPADSQATAKDLMMELSYTTEGSPVTTGSATCDV